MATIRLRVITPKTIVFEEEVLSVTAPSSEGEITVLPRHARLFSLLTEGIITIRMKSAEETLAIGSGYLQTDGKELNVLVSRAYGQDKINEKVTEQAIENAKKILDKSTDVKEREDAAMLLRRSIVDLKLLKHRRKKML
ncbi:MAG: ATP synthase F1 subunit epsilon [Patescibacteria group bacterium]